MPLGMAVAPDRKSLLSVVLSGWREQGIQVVDLDSRSVYANHPQEAAFYGVTFSADGKRSTFPAAMKRFDLRIRLE